MKKRWVLSAWLALLVLLLTACGSAYSGPAYTVLDRVELASGEGTYGDVLVTSISPSTPKSELKEIFNGIAAKENFVEMALYCTQDAYKANYSDSYSRANPNALKKGYIGSIRGGAITYSPY